MLGQFKLHDIKDCMYVEESLKQMKKNTTSNWNRVINFRFDFLRLCFIKFFGIMKMPENCQKGPFFLGYNHILFQNKCVCSSDILNIRYYHDTQP